jgi:hypothetical protein
VRAEPQPSASLPPWPPVVAESLYLRTSGAEGQRGYRSPLARRSDTLAFLDTAIEAALALPANGFWAFEAHPPCPE